MPPTTAEVRPETQEVQDILGGTCPLHPIQCCIIWVARQEKVISPLAFRLYFAAHEVKFWRSKVKPDETYHYEPFGFEPSDVCRLLPGVSEAKIAKAFGELETINVLTMTDRGIWFAGSLDDVTIDERIKQRAWTMFEQFNENTRDKIVKIPRRLLKLIVQCGRRIVRAATLIGMLLTTMLTKRTEQYSGYKGCCKAEWIGKVFSVNTKRVNSERAQLINEGWFTREPTTPRARKKFGQWVRLNLTPAQPTPDTEKSVSEESTIEETNAEESAFEELVSEETALSAETEVQPQSPPPEPKVQPLLNPFLSFQEISNNQKLPPGDPNPGAYQPKDRGKTTWMDIQLDDLKNDLRSEALWQEAIKFGHLKNSQADHINFFAAIAHALRVAKNNACGLLRTIVEKGLWHVISQADEYNGIQRLRRSTEAQEIQKERQVHANSFLATNNEWVGQVDEQWIELSEDALIVQTLMGDLKRAGVKGDVFRIVQRNGYLCDWVRERWEKAEQELAQARLLWARQRCQMVDMTSVGDTIGEGIDDDRSFNDG